MLGNDDVLVGGHHVKPSIPSNQHVLNVLNAGQDLGLWSLRNSKHVSLQHIRTYLTAIKDLHYHEGEFLAEVSEHDYPGRIINVKH